MPLAFWLLAFLLYRAPLGVVGTERKPRRGAAQDVRRFRTAQDVPYGFQQTNVWSN